MGLHGLFTGIGFFKLLTILKISSKYYRDSLRFTIRATRAFTEQETFFQNPTSTAPLRIQIRELWLQKRIRGFSEGAPKMGWTAAPPPLQLVTSQEICQHSTKCYCPFNDMPSGLYAVQRSISTLENISKSVSGQA
jgi:hypothetical protein